MVESSFRLSFWVLSFIVCTIYQDFSQPTCILYLTYMYTIKYNQSVLYIEVYNLYSVLLPCMPLITNTHTFVDHQCLLKVHGWPRYCLRLGVRVRRTYDNTQVLLYSYYGL